MDDRNKYDDYGGLHPVVAWTWVGVTYTLLIIGFAHLLLWG